MSRLDEIKNKHLSAYPEKDGRITFGDVDWLINRVEKLEKILKEEIYGCYDLDLVWDIAQEAIKEDE